LEYLPFPHLALNRFQTFTMYDYLTELHQPSTQSENNHLNEEEHIKIPDGSNSLSDNRREEPQEQNGRPTLNCSCSRTLSGENLSQIKTRNRHQPRICSLS